MHVERTWFGHAALYDEYEQQYMATLAQRMGRVEHREGCARLVKPFDLDCPVCVLLNEGTLIHAAKVLLGASLRDPSVFGFLPSDGRSPERCVPTPSSHRDP